MDVPARRGAHDGLNPSPNPSLNSQVSSNSTSSSTTVRASQDRALEEIFAEGGTLSSHISGYRLRPGQLEMARAIGQAIETQGALIAEAGTGTGKTFAYLVPALLWGGKVIVSTGTKTLQDQLFQKDLPMVRAALGAPVTVALLKGRANYLCHYHFERIKANGRMSSRQEAAQLRSIVRFAQSTRTGDKAEAMGVSESAPIWNLVTSTRENCLGAECPNYKECFVLQARREAQQADVVVVNHHLFFADLMLRDEGVADLLPVANTVIFDEAHQLPETATLFFGQTVSTAQLLDLTRDVLAEGLTHARDAVRWPEVIAPLERAARDLRLVFAQDSVRLNARQLAVDHPLFEALDVVDATLAELGKVLESQAERAESIEQCWRRAVDLRHAINDWRASRERMQQDTPPAGTEAADEQIHWVEALGHSLRLHRSPLSVASHFTRQREGTPRAWIFTSATLAVRGDFSHFADQMGLQDVPAHDWPSPFDYERQALLYVPEGLPDPSSPAYTDAVIDAALPVLRAAGGRAFVLCTTLRALRRCAERLRELFEKHELPFPLLVQGEGSRSELLERFRALGNAVLVGSQSFWEGIDVRGEALSLVIIDKLPFAPPDDPVLAARLDALSRRGGNPFMDYQLPAAVISLKQGAGRLIRDETDRGVLMLCDPRLITKPYGKRIWRSLPAFARTRDGAQAVGFFDAAPVRVEPGQSDPQEADTAGQPVT